jgi:hypothetical protein
MLEGSSEASSSPRAVYSPVVTSDELEDNPTYDIDTNDNQSRNYTQSPSILLVGQMQKLQVQPGSRPISFKYIPSMASPSMNKVHRSSSMISACGNHFEDIQVCNKYYFL